MLDPAAFPTARTTQDRWAEIEAHTAQFIVALPSARLTDVIEYVNTKGEAWSYPLWQQWAHQVNHATQHRSEVAVMLTESGVSPGDLDFLVYQDSLHPNPM